MNSGDMHNVVYRRAISSAKEDMGGVDANLFLTHESNGYAIFYQDGATWWLLCFFPEVAEYHAMEVAVEYGKRSTEELRAIAAVQVYPDLSC